MAHLTLILFSGLPGCGKTTLARRVARQLEIPLFAKDRLQSRLRALGLAGRATADGYHLLLDLAEEQLSLGVGVVLDGVFPMAGFRARAQEIAARHQALFRPIYCFCSDREAWKLRMQARVQYVPDWTPVGWDEVKRLEAGFEDWASGTALYLDACCAVEDNFSAVVQWVRMGHPG